MVAGNEQRAVAATEDATLRDLPLRKAAILIASIDHHAADQLLEQLAPEHAARVRQMVMEIGEVTPEQSEQVIAEFLQVGDEPSTGDDIRSLDRPSLPVDFSTLCAADAVRLAACLAQERPQLVAVVLTQVQAEQAVQILAGLEESLHREVLECLAALDELDPQILDDLRDELHQRLASIDMTAHTGRAGAATLEAMYGAASDTERTRLVAGLSRVEPHLLDRLKRSQQPSDRQRCDVPRQQRPPQPAFGDLLALDDAALDAVLQVVPHDTLVVALLGAADALVRRVMERLPRHAARRFLHCMEHVGPLHLRDIELAQQQIERHVACLWQQGRIELPGNHFTAAA